MSAVPDPICGHDIHLREILLRRSQSRGALEVPKRSAWIVEPPFRPMSLRIIASRIPFIPWKPPATIVTQTIEHRAAIKICEPGESMALAIRHFLPARSLVQNDTQKRVIDFQTAVIFDESEFSEFIHEDINSGTGAAHHFR
jgi:hypothetical protein